VDYHPDPAPSDLCELPDTDPRPLDRASRQLIAEWLDDRAGWDFVTATEITDYLAEHGPTDRAELPEALGVENRRVYHAAKQGLKEAGEIEVIETDWGLPTGYRLAD
jgi:hypothetical protein